MVEYVLESVHQFRADIVVVYWSVVIDGLLSCCRLLVMP